VIVIILKMCDGYFHGPRTEESIQASALPRISGKHEIEDSMPNINTNITVIFKRGAICVIQLKGEP
jgi:hypothetical protein